LPCGEKKRQIREDSFAVKYWEIIADNSARPDGVGAAYQLLILRGERSGLQTRVATTESVSSRADEKLTAFLELESAICACGKLG
jgi:hypothetical protein